MKKWQKTIIASILGLFLLIGVIAIGIKPKAAYNDYGYNNNLIPYPYYTTGNQTVNGINYIDNGDGTITLNGETTTNASTYTLYATSSDTYFNSYDCFLSSGNKTNNRVLFRYLGTNANYIDNGNGVLIPANSKASQIYIFVSPNTVVNNLTIYPMLNTGTEPLPYQPNLKLYYNDGYNDGYIDGKSEGYADGYADGLVAGKQQGYTTGYNTAVQNMGAIKQQRIAAGIFYDGLCHGYVDGDNTRMSSIECINNYITETGIDLYNMAIDICNDLGYDDASGQVNIFLYYKKDVKLKDMIFYWKGKKVDRIEFFTFNYDNQTWYTFTYQPKENQSQGQFEVRYDEIQDTVGINITLNNVENGTIITTPTYYTDIYLNGYDVGYAEGTLEQQEKSYDLGYDDGKNYGYNIGYNAGIGVDLNNYVEKNDITGWMLALIDGMSAFLSIKFGPVTLGAIILIPFSITLVWFIIRLFRGGGGD